MYTFFVIQVATLFFIAGVYGYAYRILRQQLYAALALGWLANAVYLVTELPHFLAGNQDTPTLSHDLYVVSFAIPSTMLFHIGVRVASAGHIHARHLRAAVLAASGPAASCLIAAMYARSGESHPDVYFAVATFLPTLYSSVILMRVAARLESSFPVQDFGTQARLLTASWVLYSILQFFYPLKHLPDVKTLFALIFVLAFGLKLSGAIALLNLLKQAYDAAEAQANEASVLADLGNLAAGLHHDIATPLGIIDSELELLGTKRLTDDIVQSALKNLKSPMRAIHSAVRFVDLVRQDPEVTARAFTKTSARAAIGRAVKLFQSRHPETQMRITMQGERNYFIRAHPDMIAEAFLNIVKNAAEATAGHLEIRLARIDNDRGYVIFSFRNNGPPMSEDELANCMKAGWSSKGSAVEKGNVGMGLYMTRRIISMHRGSLEVRNRASPNQGVEVIVEMPSATSKDAPD